MVEKVEVDVLVVGAGPAGSTTAEHAALNGAEVLLIEKRPVVGEPVRCGEFMPHVEEISQIFPDALDIAPLFEIPGDLRLLETAYIRLYSPKMRSWEVPFAGYTTDRGRFDQYLAKRAVKAGAKLITGVKYNGLRDGVALADGMEIKAKVVVGADGPLSKVAKDAGLGRSTDLCPAVTVQVNGDFDPMPEMYFGR